LDKRLTWLKHIFTKRKHLGITFTKLYWLLGRRFSSEIPAFDNWCSMVCSKCHYSAWLTSPIHQRRNLSPQRPVLRWTLHPSQPPSNSTLKAICFQKTEKTPAIRSTPQIHCINM
jgi:hypothetical protein